MGADVVEPELLAGRAEGRAGVQLEGAIEEPAGAEPVAAAGEPDAVVDEDVELVEVDDVGRHQQDVAAVAEVDHRVGGDPGGGQGLAQVRHVPAHRHVGARRWGVTPDAVDDAIERDHGARVEHQQRQHGPLLRAAEVDGSIRSDGRHATEAPQHGRPGVVHGGQDRTASDRANCHDADMRTRGFVMLLAAVVGIVVTILDAADDGFSLWNGVGIVCFIVVGLYGVSYVRGRPLR